MRLGFWGAAGTTTGSMHLVEAGDTRVALDCGLFQGRRAEFYERNAEMPVDPREIDAVILSHAHIDHSGNLPLLGALGFGGEVCCTKPTADLCRSMLMDSAFIQEKDVEFVNKKRRKQRKEPLDPLYRVEDAERVLQQFRGFKMHQEVCFAPRVCGEFLMAGHMLGAAVTVLDIEEKGKKHRLCFSGDIGRAHSTLLSAPSAPEHVQTLICESTYGDRESAPTELLADELAAIVERTAQRGGKVIIPAFSVGRTQDIVYHLNRLFNEGRLPRLPIYVDSPLSVNVTQAFKKHRDYYNRSAWDAMQKDPDIFGFETLHYTASVEESKALNDKAGPMVIISASGMCEAGRILHHLRNSISNPNNTVLIVGYQAEHTLGRRLLERQPKVRIFGEEHALRAEVAQLQGFSAHADANELRDFIYRVREMSGGHLERVFLVHGEDKARESLAAYVRGNLGLECHLPRRGDSAEIA
ncbi:MAG: MBL fold metallo-hydrolase [Candidatus Sumerlaeia bacterium]|nr:MBL fold metallo-hydrolase [Candidatus Sumerlaeia bacterium]